MRCSSLSSSKFGMVGGILVIVVGSFCFLLLISVLSQLKAKCSSSKFHNKNVKLSNFTMLDLYKLVNTLFINSFLTNLTIEHNK